MIYFYDVAILKTKDVNYCCIISGICKSEAIKSLQTVDLTEKVEH